MFLAAGVFGAACSSAAAGGNEVTGLTVRDAGPARYFPGTDGRTHVEYDLVITNGLQADAKLKSLVVRAGRKTVLKLNGSALADITHPLSVGILTPTVTVPPASSVVNLVDVKLPGTARNIPSRLTSSVRYAFEPSPLSYIVDDNKITLRTPVNGRPPMVIAPPLRGAGWFGFNACCENTLTHRSGLLSIDNRPTMVEAFAIDYMRIVDGSVIKEFPPKVTDWYGYGEPIHSVANGRVVAVFKGHPDAPWPPGPPNPAVKTSSDLIGNGVIVKIRPHRFALYAHMVPGSIRVRKGQRLRTGQVIGRLGNSGNSTGPHLHFAVQAKPRPLARSIPYVFDRFKFEGSGKFDDDSGEVEVKGRPRSERRTYPLAGAVATFRR